MQHHGEIRSQLSDIPVLFVIPVLESTPFIFTLFQAFHGILETIKRHFQESEIATTPLKSIDIFWTVRAFTSQTDRMEK